MALTWQRKSSRYTAWIGQSCAAEAVETERQGEIFCEPGTLFDRHGSFNAEDVKQQMQKNLKQGIYTCPLLDTETKKCSVYTVRPAICRLFGVIKGELLCPHGYTAESSALLSNEQAQKILRKVEELGN